MAAGFALSEAMFGVWRVWEFCLWRMFAKVFFFGRTRMSELQKEKSIWIFL
jgi:hypothetical protein